MRFCLAFRIKLRVCGANAEGTFAKVFRIFGLETASDVVVLKLQGQLRCPHISYTEVSDGNRTLSPIQFTPLQFAPYNLPYKTLSRYDFLHMRIVPQTTIALCDVCHLRFSPHATFSLVLPMKTCAIHIFCDQPTSDCLKSDVDNNVMEYWGTLLPHSHATRRWPVCLADTGTDRATLVE